MSPYAVIRTGFAALLAPGVILDAPCRAGRVPFAPLADALEALLATRAGRWIVFGCWLWIGVHFSRADCRLAPPCPQCTRGESANFDL
jgi:hypothetical protein